MREITAVVKVQVPLATNAPEPMAMVYNQDHSLHFMAPVTEELITRAAGTGKFYCEITLKGGRGGYRVAYSPNDLPNPGW